jgi:hypothetical protein
MRVDSSACAQRITTFACTSFTARVTRSMYITPVARFFPGSIRTL